MPSSARTRLRRKFLRIGGVGVDFIEDPYLLVIADAGAPFANTEVRIARGRPNQCHRNAALFWLRGKYHRVGVGVFRNEPYQDGRGTRRRMVAAGDRG